ncbi:MAG TPA: hypothetical protein HA254_03380 [Candidatus Diapherotrites archaeon]|uniref:Uncharacterized protein n=1 Tax=Candidatus Iainarchaeum sp. TaxID=3101447 RepID=A0A7J4IXV5_9ARCH|nr:hypothetical protein [Candidatus Diapherotrites archaeon]
MRKTFTIRQMDLPPSVLDTKRSLVRWFALSFGLLSEHESRSTILDVLDALFHFQLSRKASPTTNELLAHLRAGEKKIDEKLLRYHLKRLIDVGLLERKKGKLSFVTDPRAERSDLVAGFRHNIGEPLKDSVQRISLALEKVVEKYRK